MPRSSTLHDARARIGAPMRTLAAGLTLCASLVSLSSASTVLPLDLDGLARLADCVVEGRVLSVTSNWNVEGTAIYTDVVLGITRAEGECADAAAATRTIRLLGGTVGETAMRVDASPVLDEGEEVVLFLHEDPELFIPVVALERGKFTVAMDAAGVLQISNELVGSFGPDAFWNTVTQIQEGR